MQYSLFKFLLENSKQLYTSTILRLPNLEKLIYNQVLNKWNNITNLDFKDFY